MDLGEFAQTLLDGLSNQLVEQGISLPEVVYLAPGYEIPFDCEQLTVHLTRIISNYSGTDTPFPQPHATLMQSAEFFATMVRCVPVVQDDGSMPNPAELTTAARLLMGDARAIKRGFEKLAQKHIVVPRNVPVTVGPLNTIGPSGGFAAVTCSFTVQIVDLDNWVWDTPAGTPDRMVRV
jgi:hypothetical protein